MLYLIGLGLANRDLSSRALEEIKEADTLFLEVYTSFLPKEYLGFIEKQAGKKPLPLARKDLEENVRQTVATAKDKKVVILVSGDPLIATTHSIILNEAKKQGIGCRVIHAPSVFSIAIGESGLDVYKFGPTVTVPFWSEKYRPTSFIDAINKNLQNGQHTLVLLDIDQERNRPMSVSEAAKIILKALEENTRGPFSKDTEVLVMANIGREDQAVKLARINDMGSLADELGGKVLSLIVPGRLSFAEKESLERVSSTR